MAPKSDYENIQPGTKLVAVHVSSVPQTRFTQFMQFFHCIARKTIDDGKRLTTTYYTPSNSKEKSSTTVPTVSVDAVAQQTNKAETFSITSGEISNSSLKNVDTSSLEDELRGYIFEVQHRTNCN